MSWQDSLLISDIRLKIFLLKNYITSKFLSDIHLLLCLLTGISYTIFLVHIDYNKLFNVWVNSESFKSYPKITRNRNYILYISIFSMSKCQTMLKQILSLEKSSKSLDFHSHKASLMEHMWKF